MTLIWSILGLDEMIANAGLSRYWPQRRPGSVARGEFACRPGMLCISAAIKPVFRCVWVLFLAFAFSATAIFAQSYQYSVQGMIRGGGGTAVGINNSGLVIGRSGTNYNTEARGFVWGRGPKMQTLASLPGGDFSEAAGINDLGDITGSFNTNANLRALLWTRNGEVRELGALPGDSASRARSINIARQVVGSSMGPNGVSGFLWTKREGMQRLAPLPGSDFSEATAINNAGVIAGTAGLAHGDHRAVRWDNPWAVRALGVLAGDTGSESYAINDLGQIVGASTGRSGVHAWIWNNKEGMRSLGSFLGGNYTIAFGINNLGQVVGTSTTAVGASHAFIWTANGGMRDLNDLIPDASRILLVSAVGINDRGQIIAYGGDRDAFNHDALDLLGPLHPQLYLSGTTGGSRLSEDGVYIFCPPTKESFCICRPLYYLLTPKGE
jgi:probable HAF family extracellular repeat protein